VYVKELGVGNTLVIKIKGNITTGYGWYLDNPKELHEEKIISPLNLDEHNSAEYVTDKHEKGMSGVGGNYYFKFKLLSATNGTTPLRFVNKRAWEKEDFTTINVNLKIN